ALLGKVGINVEHSTVVVAHRTEPVSFHNVSHARSFHPLRDFIPGNWIVFQYAGHLKKRNAAAIENVGNLGNRTSRAVCQPLASHFGTVSEFVEGLVIDGCGWR